MISAIFIAGSTGAPKQVLGVLSQLNVFPLRNSSVPPIIICQHMSRNFMETFKKGISQSVTKEIECFLISDTTELKRGCIYIVNKTPRSLIFQMNKVKNKIFLELVARGYSDSVFRPNIDKLFSTAGDSLRAPVFMLLSGIGNDGSMGLRSAQKNKMAEIYIQDPKESLTNGMLLSAVGETGISPWPFSSIKRHFLEILKQYEK